MIPTFRTKLLRASACRSDLLANGIDLDTLDPSVAAGFVRLNLDYFQCMLGYDAGVPEVVSLLRRSRTNAQPGRVRLLTL